MKLVYELAEREKELILSRSGGDDIIYCVPSDLTLSGRLRSGWVVVTRKKLFVVEDNTIINDIDLESTSGYKCTILTGSGILEGFICGVQKIIVQFTMRHVPRYACIAGALNSLSCGKDPDMGAGDDEIICAGCGRILPEDSRLCPKCTKKTAVLKRLIIVIKPLWPRLLAAGVLFWLISGISIVNPYIYRLFIENCLTPGSAGFKPDPIPIVIYMGIITLLQIANTALTSIRGCVMVGVGCRLAADLRNMVYSKLQALSLGYLDKKKTGDLMNRVSNDTGRISGFIQEQAVFGINQLLIMVGICIVLFATNWKLALMILLPVPLVMVFMRLSWQYLHDIFHKQWKLMVKADSLLQDILSGIRVVKTFGQEERESGRFRNASRKVADIASKNEKLFNTIFPGISFVISIGQFFVLYYGSKLVLGKQMEFGELIQFTQYSAILYGPLGFMSFLPRMFADAMQAIGKVFEIVDTEPDINDSKVARSHKINGAVSFRNVSFGYQTHEPVLEDICLDVTPGEMIGLVGHSGAGKSTLINLLMRFYDMNSGQILVDGIDIKDICQQDLRSQLGVVLQETFLFTGSILENIRYSKPDAKLEEVITAARIANAHDFIIHFPNGYDTMVGENGCNLSGGERQRIAIARAILHNPRILILDEATASLDIDAEHLIQEALGRLIKNRTTFAIAHRLSTLRNATRLMVIDKGKKAEIGTHDELMKQKGIYYSLVMAQRQITKLKEEHA